MMSPSPGGGRCSRASADRGPSRGARRTAGERGRARERDRRRGADSVKDRILDEAAALFVTTATTACRCGRSPRWWGCRRRGCTTTSRTRSAVPRHPAARHRAAGRARRRPRPRRQRARAGARLLSHPHAHAGQPAHHPAGGAGSASLRPASLERCTAYWGRFIDPIEAILTGRRAGELRPRREAGHLAAARHGVLGAVGPGRAGPGDGGAHRRSSSRASKRAEGRPRRGRRRAALVA